MEKIYPQSKLEYVNLGILGIISYLFSCALQQKLLYLDIILKENISKRVLEFSFVYLCVLVGIYLINYCIIKFKNREKISRIVYENICKDIFNRFIKTKQTPDIPFDQIKVSLLKAFKRETTKPFLKVVGRYQIRTPKKNSSVKFLPGEGCAGIAYQTNVCIQRAIDEYDYNNPEKYYKDSKDVFNLPQKKAKKLNDKACDFMCIPIRYYGQDEPWGILSIDSMKKGFLGADEARKIEDVLSCFSVFLMI